MERRQYGGAFNLWRPGRRTKALAFVVGGIFAFISFGRPNGYGWVGAILMASAAVAIPMLQFRQLWRSTRFWVVIGLLAVVQVPLITWARVLAEQYRALFLLAFGISDGIFVIAVIASVCLTRKRTGWPGLD